MALQRICDPMLPELSRVFQAPISEVSQVISFFAIAYGLMQLFYGPVGDRFGKCRVVMLATIGCSVGSLLSALSADLPFLVAVRVGTALAAAAIIPLSLAWVGDVVHYEHRQETLARVGLGTMLGITAGQLFGGLLTDTLGWRWAFALMAAAFATVSFLLWQQLKHLEPVAPPAHAPHGRPPRGSPGHGRRSPRCGRPIATPQVGGVPRPAGPGCRAAAARRWRA